MSSSSLGAAYEGEIVWKSKAATRTTADADLGVEATRLRARFVRLLNTTTRVGAMETIRTDVASANYGTSVPYQFVFLFYEQVRPLGPSRPISAHLGPSRAHCPVLGAERSVLSSSCVPLTACC